MKNELIKQIAPGLELPEDLIFKVISFQGADALEAIRTAHEIEFSGFGKFLLSQTKLKRKLEVYEKAVIKYQDNPEKVEAIKQDIEKYKLKLR